MYTHSHLLLLWYQCIYTRTSCYCGTNVYTLAPPVIVAVFAYNNPDGDFKRLKRTLTYVYTRTHTHTHAHTRTYTNIHTRALSHPHTLPPTRYSTRAGGECKAGERPGDGSCFWREVKVLRNANATCVRKNFLDGIRKHNTKCYSACPQPNNVSSTCYVQCLLDTIDGDMGSAGSPDSSISLSASVNASASARTDRERQFTAGKPRPRMTRVQLVKPFLDAFASADPSKGGCPEVPVE